MPPIVIAAAVAAGGAVGGAALSSRAAGKSAQLQTASADKSAELQAKANADALAFQKQQEADDQARFEATQQANYNQYLTHYKAAQQLGSEMGFRLPDAQPYVPVTKAAGTPAGASPGPAAGAPPAAAPGGIPKSTGDVAKDLALANQITGGNSTDVGYWVNAGYAKDPQYFFQKMLGMDAGPQDAPKQGPYAGATGRTAAPIANMSTGFSKPIAAYLNPSFGGGAPPLPQTPAVRLRGINAYL